MCLLCLCGLNIKSEFALRCPLSLCEMNIKKEK